MKKTFTAASAFLLAALLGVSLTACKTPDPSIVPAESGTASPNTSTAQDSNAPLTVTLTFNGTQLSTSVQNSGIVVEDNAFVITRGGTYELRGDLSNGQIKVAVGKEADVELILNNFTATCNTSAPLYIESANKATVYLAAGTVNTLTDAKAYLFKNALEDKPNACLYSADDMTIRGSGTLKVNASYNNGIGCRNDLRIKECTLEVSAPNNIIKGNDSVEIEDATLKLAGGEDAIKADTTDRVDKGYILITADAKIEISCTDDAIQAANSITVEAGASVTGVCGGDIFNCPGIIQVDPGSIRME